MVDVLRDLGYLITDWLVDVSAEPGFWSGFVAGMAGLAIAASVVFQVKVWWGKVTAPLQPQRVTHTTDKTPAQMLVSSCTTLVVGVLVFICAAALIIEVLVPGTLQRLLQALGL
jgi:hypothetical protein